MRVPNVSDGNSTSSMPFKYFADVPNEGEIALLHRPPSLWHRSVQPREMVIYDRPCIGLNPSDCADYHADFDGDEMHLTPLKNKHSLAQAAPQLHYAADQFRDVGIAAFEDRTEMKSIPNSIFHTDRQSFMKFENVSFMQMLRGVPLTKHHKSARMKSEFVDRTVERFKSHTTESTFVDESIRGIKDVMTQQLSQGKIGDMTRTARLSSSCFIVKDSVPYIVSMSKLHRVPMTRVQLSQLLSEGGNVCMRGVNVLGSLAQQVALDSHRASEGVQSVQQFDMISSFMLGSSECLVITQSRHYGDGVLWECELPSDATNNPDKAGYVYLMSDVPTDINPDEVRGTWCPLLLNYLSQQGKTWRELASVLSCAIRLICNYHNVVELLALLWSIGNAIVDPIDICKFIVMIEGGGNGKSTITRIFNQVLRGCIAPLPPGTLNSPKLSSDALDAVSRNRVVIDADADLSNGSLNVSIVRSITGHDITNINNLSVTLNCSILCGTNNMPDVNVVNEWKQPATFRRLVTVPMRVNAMSLSATSMPSSTLDYVDFAVLCVYVRCKFSHTMPITPMMVMMSLLGSRWPFYNDLFILEDGGTAYEMLCALELVAVITKLDSTTVLQLANSLSRNAVAVVSGVEVIKGVKCIATNIDIQMRETRHGDSLGCTSRTKRRY